MKLKIKNLNKLINSMSSREIDFYLYLIKRQSDIGFVEGVTHSKMQEDIGMPRSTFHVILNSLEEKGVIRVDWNNHNKYFNIYLIDNSFINKNDFKEGYVNINLDFILSSEFISLNVNLKKFFLRLLGLQAHKKPVKLLSDTLKRYKVNRLLDELYALFDIVILDDIFTFSIKEILLWTSHNDDYLQYEHKIKVYCEDYNLKYTPREFKDTVRSIINHARKNRMALIHRALDSIRRIGRLQPKLINHICKPAY